MTLFLPAAFLGIVVGLYLEGHSAPAWPFLALGIAGLPPRRLRPVAVGLLVLAAALLARRAERPAGDECLGYWVYAASAVEGRLVQPPVVRTNNRIRLVLAVDRLELFRYGTQAAVGRVAVYADATNQAAEADGRRFSISALRAGDRLQVAGELELVPDTPAGIRTAYERLGIEGLVYTPQAVRRLARAAGFPGDVGAWLTVRLERLGPRAGAFLRAMLLGDKSGFAAGDSEAFRRAGVAHLLAVSGLHVGALAACGVLLFAALGLGRRRAALVTAALLPCYALLCGAMPSVLRATIAGTAALLLLAAGRRSSAWHLLSLAGIVILAGDPAALGTPGFLLSFAATAGILAWRGGLERGLAALRCPRRIRVPLAVSLAAQLAVLPVGAAIFGTVAPWGPLANLLVVPLALAALGLGVVGALAGITAAALPIEAVMDLVGLLAVLPGAQLALPAFTLPSAAAYYLFLCACLLPRRRPPACLVAGVRDCFAETPGLRSEENRGPC
jgi:ComEC/Rec2-related protein